MSHKLPDDFNGNEIAVVGMAGRFPGADTLEEFWSNLEAGRESIRRLTDDELRAAGVPESLIADPEYVKAAAPLKNMEHWDAAFWGFTPLEGSIMDPQHRLFLDCSYEALETAGIAPAQFSGAIGVFAGCGIHTYLAANLLPNRKLMDQTGYFLVRHTGNDKDFLATRVSYQLDLRGPSVSVQTACSTSLVAIHMAAQSLLNGECDVALAGGVTIELPHGVGYQHRNGEVLSPDGRCKTFDASSQGTVFGSGAGVVVLRRLQDALDGGDTIYAVLRGSAVNNDGSRKVGYLAPSVDGQAASIAEAIGVAGISPDTISYVEAHGTGTPLGDTIEVSALTQSFRSAAKRTQYCAIGSLKTAIGHLDTAAGVAGFIKTVLAMRSRVLPASLNFVTPNPAIDFPSTPFRVNAARTDWKSDGPRRALVASLGVGGTNAHVVLEEAPPLPATDKAREQQLIVLSAKTREALDQMSNNLADHLVEHPDADLADVAWTLQDGRQPLKERRILVATSRDEARTLLDTQDKDRVATQTASDSAAVAFLFAGGGAQYAGMGADLYRDEPVFRQTVDECLALLKPQLDVDLKTLLYPADGAAEAAQAELERPSRALPALFTTQLAMARLLMSWGLVPDAFVGHSMGEYTAAHLAGVFSLKDALSVVTLRGRLFEKVPEGAMLSVPLPEAELTPLLGPELSVAAVNAPALCVASGPVRAIDELERTLSAREIDCRRVRINVAAHSAMLEPILEEFGAFFRTIRMQPPTMRFASNLSGTWITAAEATDPSYWVRHLRSTVRFADGLRETLQDPHRVLVEVGPGRVLATLAKQHPDRRESQPIMTSMRHPDEKTSDVAFALGALGRAWAAGAKVDWAAVHNKGRRRHIALPTYPFEKQRHWVVAPTFAQAGADPELPEGVRFDDVGRWFYQPQWKRARAPAGPAERRRVLLFATDDALGNEIAARMQQDHDVVRVVRPGETDYDKLLAALRSEKTWPSEIVHAWNVGPAGNAGTAEIESRAFYSLFALAQAIGRDEGPEPIRLTVISSGMQQVAGEDVTEPARATLLGPVRVMPQEFPNVHARSIDVEAAPPGSPRSKRLAAAIASEIGHDLAGDTVAWRGVDRFVQAVEHVTLPHEGASRLRKEGVYLVTGGLGGLGYAVAEFLAREYQARLILTGRKASAARARPLVEPLEALGAQVMVESMDVADPTQVQRVVAAARQRFGGIHGVFHAAGVLDDALSMLKTPASAAQVLAPKVRGTLALDAALTEPLDIFVLFSSISALAGLAGQIDYTAANAFLDAFAHSRHARDGGYTVAIGWSAWRDVGMAARVAAGGNGHIPEGDAGHPLLGRRLHGSASEDLFAVELGTASHWVLDEHRIRGGHALIPGTGYLEIARAAVESRGENRPVEIRDLAFVSPFVVDDGVPREMRVHLQRDGGGTGLVIAGRYTSDEGEEGWQEHVTASASYVDATRPAPLDLDAIRKRCNARHESFTGSEPHAHLNFGPRWKNLREVHYGRTEALARLELPEPFAGDVADYRMHPALMDMATTAAEPLVPGFDPDADFYVPLSYTRLVSFAPLPRRIASHIRLAESEYDTKDVVVFDVTITGEQGNVLVDIEGFMMARVTDTEQLSGESRRNVRRASVSLEVPPAAPAPPLATGLDEAILPREGIDALRRILIDGAAPQTIVAWKDLGTMLADARRPAVRAPRATPSAAAVPGVDLHEIERVLLEHEAVEQAVVMARANRPGEIKLVAYVTYDPDAHVTVSDLRRFLKSRLAAPMVPSTFVSLDTMPADRSELPDPFGAEDDYVAPRTDMERLVADTWKEVLGLEQIGAHDNFFDVGGHSLLALRVVTKIDKKIGVRLNPAIMVLQTLEQIAADCEKRKPATPGTPAPKDGDGSPKLAQRLFNALTGR